MHGDDDHRSTSEAVEERGDVDALKVLQARQLAKKRLQGRCEPATRLKATKRRAAREPVEQPTCHDGEALDDKRGAHPLVVARVHEICQQ